jgi:hypothetical protein
MARVDRKTVEAIAPPLVRRIRAKLGGLPGWNLEVRYEAVEGAKAQATIRPEYSFAIVVVDPEAAIDAADLARSIAHELLHVLLAPLEHYFAAVYAMLPTARTREAEYELRRRAVESCVVGLETALGYHQARELFDGREVPPV